MARLHTLIKEFGSIAIGASRQSLEKQTLKPLGDVVSWSIMVDATSIAGTGTYVSSTGTPAAHLGSNILDVFNKVDIKDRQGSNIFSATREEVYLMGWLLSTLNADEQVITRGDCRAPIIDTASITGQVQTFTIPQAIALSDLPATLDIELGVLDDYYDSAGNGTLTLNQLAIYVRYISEESDAFTLRCKSFQVPSVVSADSDIAQSIPEGLSINRMAFAADNISAVAAPTNDDLTRVDKVTFKRGSNDEIDAVATEVLVDLQNQHFSNKRHSGDQASFAQETFTLGAPLGIVIIPTTAFTKGAATTLKLEVNGNVQPVLYYVYQ